MSIAAHLDDDLRERLTRALATNGREPFSWPTPVRRDDLRRLMAAAGIEPPGGFCSGEVFRPDAMPSAERVATKIWDATIGKRVHP